MSLDYTAILMSWSVLTRLLLCVTVQNIDVYNASRGGSRGGRGPRGHGPLPKPLDYYVT